MKVLEIKNNLVKISYDTADNIALSGFVIIEDNNNPYVAQVVNIKGDTDSNYAIVKLLFTFDNDGILKNYNGTIPSVKAKVSVLPAGELLDIIPINSPIFLGNLAQQNVALNVDKSIFENNLLICSDNLYNTTNLLDNLIKQLDEKSLIIDLDGQISAENKLKICKDFKLPLNYEAIDYIYENELEDVDSVNKAIIQDIFIEVQNYVKTLPDNFVPFDSFINVIDLQYKETKIPELILLKNKLIKYKAMDVFAQNLQDIMTLGVTIENNNSSIVDISGIPDNMKKFVIEYIYDVLNVIGKKIYSFVKISNSNANKKLLKKLIEKDTVFTTIICPHEFKYIEELKEVAQNIIFFAPLTLTHDFASYNTFLSKLNGDEFVVYGAHTQNIPFITEVTDIKDKAVAKNNSDDEFDEYEKTEFTENDAISEEIINGQDEEFSDINIDDDNYNISEDEITETENIEIVENVPENINEDLPEVDNVISEDSVIEDSEIISEVAEDDNIKVEELEQADEIIQEESAEDSGQPNDVIQPVIEDVAPQETEPQEVESDEIVSAEAAPAETNDAVQADEIITADELIDAEPEDNAQINEQADEVIQEETPVNDDVIVETLEPNEEPENKRFVSSEEIKEQYNQAQIDEQISKDVDRMFYEKFDNNDETDDFSATSDDLTEDELNIIEDLVEEDIPLAGKLDDINIVEDEDLPPVVPIYPAEEFDKEQDSVQFQPGDIVNTVKYGQGTVLKMVKYGNKYLCSINFPSQGRNILLDPTMTEISKIG